jgi:hypothetical protein
LTGSLVGLGLALLGLVPLGAGVLLLTRTRFGFGLAVFAGMAAAMVVLPPLYYLGLDPSLWLVLLLGAVVLGAGVLFRRLVPRRGASRDVAVRRGTRTSRWLSAAVLAVPLVLLAARAAEKPVDRYDAFANWTLKAKLLHFGRSFADASVAPPVHREYPLGLPALEAYVLDWTGGADVRGAHVLFVVFLAGLAVVAWRVLRPYVAVWPLTAGLSLLLWMPAARDQALSAYADVPLACLFCSAALLLGSGQVALGSVFAAAALATKRDAVAFLVVLYAVAAVAALVTGDRRRLRSLGLSVAFVALSAVPWRVYDAVHGLHDNDVSPSLSRTDDLPFTLGRLAHVLLERAYLWAIPLAVAASVVLLVRRRDRRIALAVLALEAGLLAALALVYVSGTTGVRYLVRSTVERTVMTPTLLAAALLPLLVTRALAVEAPAAGRSRPPRQAARSRGRKRRRAPRPRQAGRRRRSTAGRARAPSS